MSVVTPYGRLVAVEIYPSGDPYSRAWDATRVYYSDRMGYSYFYAGDISGMFRKRRLIFHIEKLHPHTSIHMKWMYRKEEYVKRHRDHA